MSGAPAGPAAARGRPRLWEGAALTLIVLALGAFAGGLLSSKPPPAPSVVVQGEPLLAPGAPVALRLSAAMPGADKHSTITGRVTLTPAQGEAVSADIVDGTARLDGAGPGALEADVVVDKTVHAVVRGAIEESRAHLTEKLIYQPWEGDMLMGRRGGRPLYPVDGQVSGRLPSKLLVLDKETSEPTVVEVAPQIQGAEVDGGRVLRVDRSGLRLQAPLEVDSGGTVDVTVISDEKRAVGLDLLAAGVVVDAQNVEVDGRATVKLRLGRAAPGTLLVVHAGGTWPDELGRFAVLRVHEDKPLLSFIETQMRAAGAPAGDPLLSWLKKHPGDVTASRALLQRLWPAKRRAPKLVTTVVAPPPLARAWLTAYGVLASLAFIVVSILGMVRLPGRRWQALAAAVALGALLAGLAAVLVFTGR